MSAIENKNKREKAKIFLGKIRDFEKQIGELYHDQLIVGIYHVLCYRRTRCYSCKKLLDLGELYFYGGNYCYEEKRSYHIDCFKNKLKSNLDYLDKIEKYAREIEGKSQ